MTNLTIQDGDTVVIAMTVEMSTPNYHHLQIWQSSGAMTPDRYKIVTETTGKHINPNTFEMDFSNVAMLLVKDEEARDEFNEWWIKYSERFSGLEHETFLPVPSNNFISGYMVQHANITAPVMQVPSPISYKDEWAFIVANCPGKVYWTITHWIFEDQNDAVMFKLKRK